MPRSEHFLAKLGRAGEAAENTLLALILLAMVGLSASQIVLRNFFDIGFYWSDELLRMMVLWIALAGAVAATRSDKHISINLLETIAGPRLRSVLRALVHLFSLAICGLLAGFSMDFVGTSREYGDVLLGGVPAWVLQLVLPAGFGLMTYRYSVLLLTDLVGFAGASSPRAGQDQ
jgi:TRAP-type C4-dicarboxylate transport system permease small subunit